MICCRFNAVQDGNGGWRTVPVSDRDVAHCYLTEEKCVRVVKAERIKEDNLPNCTVFFPGQPIYLERYPCRANTPACMTQQNCDGKYGKWQTQQECNTTCGFGIEYKVQPNNPGTDKECPKERWDVCSKYEGCPPDKPFTNPPNVLSAGIIAAIIICVVIAFIAGIAILMIVHRRRKRRRRMRERPMDKHAARDAQLGAPVVLRSQAVGASIMEEKSERGGKSKASKRDAKGSKMEAKSKASKMESARGPSKMESGSKMGSKRGGSKKEAPKSSASARAKK